MHTYKHIQKDTHTHTHACTLTHTKRHPCMHTHAHRDTHKGITHIEKEMHTNAYTYRHTDNHVQFVWSWVLHGVNCPVYVLC